MSINTTFTMEQAIRASVTSAFKAIEFKKYHVEQELILDSMLEDVFALMFPKTGAQEVAVPVVVPEPKKKKTKPKKDEAMDELADGVAAMTVDVKPVKEKKTKPKKEEEADVKVEEAPVKEKKKAAPKEKKLDETKVAGPVNIDKFNPTQTKKIKQISEELKVEVDKKALLTYMNALTTDEFDAKKIEDHIRSYLTPKVDAPAKDTTPDQEVECDEVEFNGKTYYVNPVSGRVYEEQGEVNVAVGYVGMAEFKDLVL